MHPLQDLKMKRTRRRPPIFHREIVRVAGAMLASLLILCLTTTASAAECASWCSRDGHGHSLRYSARGGKEKRLNTKVPWEELREAESIMIKLQSVVGSGGRRFA